MISYRPKILITIALILTAGLFSYNQASADTLNQTEKFFTNTTYDHANRTSITATLHRISNKAYFYIEDEYWDSISEHAQGRLIKQIESIAGEFDNRIHPITTAFFGSEPNPGIDGDPKITILFTQLKSNIGGFFDGANENPISLSPESNAREMISINPTITLDMELRRVYAFIAHEFQHLISVNQKDIIQHVQDNIWTNELRSEYAITLLGYNEPFEGSSLQRRTAVFSQNPSYNFNEWRNTEYEYAKIAVLGEYIAEHWGPQVVADTIRVSVSGSQAIDAALARNGYLDSFEDILKYWQIANTINDTSRDPRFGYTNSGFSILKRGDPTTVAGLIDWAIARPHKATLIVTTPTINTTTVATPTSTELIPTGSLVRARGQKEVYLIQNITSSNNSIRGYRRHIVNAKIFPLYSNWGFDKVIEVSPETLTSYQESRLLRSTVTDRVYEIDKNNNRRWLKITEKQFLTSGRKPESIFNINPQELVFYRASSAITK